MRYSKSILIFLFVLSTTNVFYWSLKRNKGNIGQSTIFAMYFFLCLKIDPNAFLPKVKRRLDQDQSSQKIIRVVPGSNLNYSDSNYGRSKIYMTKIEPEHYMTKIEPGYFLHSKSVIKDVRAGGRLKDAAFLLAMLYLLNYHTVGFQQMRQIPAPPHLELPNNYLFGQPKSNSQSRLHFSKSNRIFKSGLPTQTQVSSFRNKDGSIDLQQAFNEVKRRASVIGGEKCQCSLERFKDLATEGNNIQEGSVREAITVLEGEMRGYYRNARRGDYGDRISGLDFVVEGLGEFENITHVEIKNPVSSSIEPNIPVRIQGQKCVIRLNKQKEFWCNKTQIESTLQQTIKSETEFPKSPNNTMGIYDLWDVGNSEKPIIKQSITNTSIELNDANYILLNYDKNI